MGWLYVGWLYVGWLYVGWLYTGWLYVGWSSYGLASGAGTFRIIKNPSQTGRTGNGRLPSASHLA
jgi:hypothetical protein